MKTILEKDGYLFLKQYEPHLTTYQVAVRLGKVFDIAAYAPVHRMGVVQSLTPKASDAHALNTYHGNFGIAEYPAHSDLAHWSRPPRYLLLRAKIGAPEVATYVHPRHATISVLDEAMTAQAIFVPRKSGSRNPVPLSMRPMMSNGSTLRWDSIFILPINSAACECASAIKSSTFIATRREIRLEDFADTLLIDNWTCLHGRSPIPDGKNRNIERIYLEEMHD